METFLKCRELFTILNRDVFLKIMGQTIAVYGNSKDAGRTKQRAEKSLNIAQVYIESTDFSSDKKHNRRWRIRYERKRKEEKQNKVTTQSLRQPQFARERNKNPFGLIGVYPKLFLRRSPLEVQEKKRGDKSWCERGWETDERKKGGRTSFTLTCSRNFSFFPVPRSSDLSVRGKSRRNRIMVQTHVSETSTSPC